MNTKTLTVFDRCKMFEGTISGRYIMIDRSKYVYVMPHPNDAYKFVIELSSGDSRSVFHERTKVLIPSSYKHTEYNRYYMCDTRIHKFKFI